MKISSISPCYMLHPQCWKLLDLLHEYDLSQFLNYSHSDGNKRTSRPGYIHFSARPHSFLRTWDSLLHCVKADRMLLVKGVIE